MDMTHRYSTELNDEHGYGHHSPLENRTSDEHGYGRHSPLQYGASDEHGYVRSVNVTVRNKQRTWLWTSLTVREQNKR